MNSIVAHGAHDLRIEEHADPAPGPGEVLIRLARGGICGSDLHYFERGGFGDVVLREPMILGHEVCGHIAALGPGVEGLAVSDLVAVSPSRPCYHCALCRRGQQNHCPQMQFYGSAMPFPHVQGAFRELLVARAEQCVIANGLSLGEAALAEPLAVVLHAVGKAGDLCGRRVLVTGCGPIGLLAVMLARHSAAQQVVATDLTRFTLDMARQMGADEVFQMPQQAEAFAPYQAGKGHFDVLIECSGAAAALRAAVPAMRPGGMIVQLGLGGDMHLPVQAMTAREVQWRGAFRFHDEFALAVAMMRSGRLAPGALVTQTLPMAQARAAFELATDRGRAIKVQLAFNT